MEREGFSGNRAEEIEAAEAAIAWFGKNQNGEQSYGGMFADPIDDYEPETDDYTPEVSQPEPVEDPEVNSAVDFVKDLLGLDEAAVSAPEEPVNPVDRLVRRKHKGDNPFSIEHARPACPAIPAEDPKCFVPKDVFGKKGRELTEALRSYMQKRELGRPYSRVGLTWFNIPEEIENKLDLLAPSNKENGGEGDEIEKYVSNGNYMDYPPSMVTIARLQTKTGSAGFGKVGRSDGGGYYIRIIEASSLGNVVLDGYIGYPTAREMTEEGRKGLTFTMRSGFVDGLPAGDFRKGMVNGETDYEWDEKIDLADTYVKRLSEILDKANGIGGAQEFTYLQMQAAPQLEPRIRASALI